MFKATLFALAALVLVCAQENAQAPADKKPVEIVKQVEEVDVNKYNFEYETSDGTSRQETGEYKNDTEQQGLVVRGSYKYVAPDGQHISVSFVADKNGYQPKEEGGDQKSAASEPAAQPAVAPAPAAPAPAPAAPEAPPQA